MNPFSYVFFFSFSKFYGLVADLKCEMAAPAAGGQWYRGKVKAVPSGDSLVVTALSALKAGPPRDKTLTLSSVIAPRLVILQFLYLAYVYMLQLC